MATYATLVTSKGDIRARLFDDTAPKTVENFIGLATGKKTWRHPRTGEQRNDSLYAGTLFHRVIPDFMIQGGDPLGTGTGGPGYKFEDEVAGGPSFDGKGYLAMANAGPNTNGSQFFITVAPTPWLNGKHTIFGKVVEGQDVADAISIVPSFRDKPNVEVVLQEIRIEEVAE
jgi:peptidyl-prolyl cis-trans isomerase A (cyclophilin A)